MKHEFKVGDTVMITPFRPDIGDEGFLWNSCMDYTLGRKGVIKDFRAGDLYKVEVLYESSTNSDSWWYKAEWLSPVESKAKSDWFSDSFFSVPWPSLDFRRCEPIKAPKVFYDSLLPKSSPPTKLTLINTTKLLTHIKLD